MKDKKNIEQLFSDTFQNFEAPVNPDIWVGVANGIGASTAASAAGLSVVSKIIIAATTISVIGVGGFVVLNSAADENKSVVKDNTMNVPTETVESAQLETVEDNRVVDSNNDGLEKFTVNEGVSQSDESVASHERSAGDANTVITDKSDFVDLNDLANELQENLAQQTTNEPILSSRNNPDIPSETIIINESTSEQLEDMALVSLERETQEVFLEKLPNVVSPNNHLMFKTRNISYFRIEVYSIQGKLVYQSEDPNMLWDAMDVPAGKYVYQLELKDVDGNLLKPIVERLEILK